MFLHLFVMVECLFIFAYCSGSASIVSGCVALWLPETLGSPFVETLEDLMVLREHAKPFFAWWSASKVEKNIKFINDLKFPYKQEQARKSIAAN